MGDHTVGESSEPGPCKDEDEKIEPGKLLEDCWFFGNSLHGKPRVFMRSYSDPCTSSNYGLPGKSYEETYGSIQKLPGHDVFKRSNLMRTSSVPPSMETKCQKLSRETSLPTTLENEEFEDEEMEFSMGKLIRQASLNNSDIIPHAAKGLTSTSSSISSTRKPSIKLDGLGNVRNQLIKTQKSLSDVGSGFDFEDMIPGLQDKRIEQDEEKNMMRSYISEAQKSAPQSPTWGSGKRSTEEMKAQIKFWARAVASNVRQEC